MKLTLVARDKLGTVVARADVGVGRTGAKQSDIFLRMAQQYEIHADRVDPYADDVSAQQADFVIDPRQMPRFFEFCGTQDVPVLQSAIDILKAWGRQGDVQWRLQHKGD